MFCRIARAAKNDNIARLKAASRDNGEYMVKFKRIRSSAQDASGLQEKKKSLHFRCPASVAMIAAVFEGADMIRVFAAPMLSEICDGLHSTDFRMIAATTSATASDEAASTDGANSAAVTPTKIIGPTSLRFARGIMIESQNYPSAIAASWSNVVGFSPTGHRAIPIARGSAFWGQRIFLLTGLADTKNRHNQSPNREAPLGLAILSKERALDPLGHEKIAMRSVVPSIYPV